MGVKIIEINEEKHRVLKNPSGRPKRKVRLMMYNCI
jgi:hypothetical protein